VHRRTPRTSHFAPYTNSDIQVLGDNQDNSVSTAIFAHNGETSSNATRPKVSPTVIRHSGK